MADSLLFLSFLPSLLSFSFFPSFFLSFPSLLSLHHFLPYCYFVAKSWTFIVMCGDIVVKCFLNTVLIKNIFHSHRTCMSIFSFNPHNLKIFRENYFFHFTNGILGVRQAKYQTQVQQLHSHGIAVVTTHLPILTSFMSPKIIK